MVIFCPVLFEIKVGLWSKYDENEYFVDIHLIIWG
nr:MAG TPA: hypothetical protein [Caudoviricetes sp.]